MKYIINLYNTIPNAQDVADRLNIDGTVLPNLKVIHVDNPTQEQVDLWLKDADIKNIIPDQITIIDDVSTTETINADSVPTNEETFSENISGETTQSTLAFTSGATNYHYWHLDAVSNRPRQDQARANTYNYTRSGINVDLYIMDSGVAGAKLQSNGGAATNAKTPTADVIGIMHPEFEDPAFPAGYRVVDGGVPGLNIGSGSGWQNEDTQGHGTYCAMFAAGKLSGFAKKAYIWSAKCMDGGGTGDNSGTFSDMQLAMDKIILHHQTKANGRPSVCNISIGVPFYRDSADIRINEVTGDTVFEMFDDNEKIMASAGIFISRSAGNGIKDNANDKIPQGGIQAAFVTGPRTSATTQTIPWNIEDINQPKLGVGALEDVAIVGQSSTPANTGNGYYNLQLTKFSNHGNAVEISAPGSDLISPFWNADDHLSNNSWATASAGTSYSAPMVGGVACLRYEEDPGAAPAAIKTFILDAASKSYDYQNLTEFSKPHDQRFPIVNNPKYIDSPIGNLDNMQAFSGSHYIALRVSPYHYGVAAGSNETAELEHMSYGSVNSGEKTKIAIDDYVMFDEQTKTDIGHGLPNLHGIAHRAKFRFSIWCDLEVGHPVGNVSTPQTPTNQTPVLWAVDSNSANNGTIQLTVVHASPVASNKVRVWLNKSNNNYANGNPFDISSITSSDWNGKFLTQANASGVYFGKISNFTVATSSEIDTNKTSLNGWIVLYCDSTGNANISTDGQGLKIANLSGTNLLGVNTTANPDVTYNAIDSWNGSGNFRDGLLLDVSNDTISTVTMNALYDSGTTSAIRDYLPIQETPQRLLYSWYVTKELRVPNLAGSGFIAPTSQSINALQGEVINLNLGMCWVDTSSSWLIGYQHLEADAQSYSLTGDFPSGLTLNTTTGVVTGTITADQTVSNTFTISAHGISASYTFNIIETDETGYFYDGTDLRIPGRVIDNWIEVKTDNYQLAVNKNYMIDSGALTGLPMNLTMPSSAKMGDTIILMDATSTASTNSWIIDPNGLKIHTPGSGTSTWTVSSVDVQYELVYFESTRSAGLTGWIIRVTS